MTLVLLLFEGGGTDSTPVVAGMHVREKPPLRLSIDAETPNGRHFRWAEDEPDPAYVPSGLGFSSTMPGGFEALDCTLPRRTAVAYSDLERLSTLTVHGPGGDTAWQGRLERAPRVSGDQLNVSPSAVGWQAGLEDNKQAQMIYRDIDLSRWGEDSTQHQLALATSSIPYNGGGVTPDATTGAPSLKLELAGPSGNWPASGVTSEATYDAGSGCRIGSIYYAWKKSSLVGTIAPWLWAVYTDSVDTFGSATGSGNLRAAGPGTGTLTAGSGARYGLVQLFFGGTGAGTTDALYDLYFTTLAVYGDHGLTLRGTEPNAGFYASDIASHAVSAWTGLTYSPDNPDSAFVIEHASFPDPTTAAEIITQALRFHSDWTWFVWDDKTFHLHPKQDGGRTWRARIAPTQLSETGPQVDRLFRSAVVSFADVDGSTRTVGPPGSNADTEDASLVDTDPLNPINQLGIERRALLQMQTATTAGAIQAGAIFLQEQKLLDTSGQATLVGHVEDDRGVVHPAWRVRAGDSISFIDSSSPEPRRVTKANYDHASRTTTVDLDSPSEGLSALLERLGANALSPLGLS